MIVLLYKPKHRAGLHARSNRHADADPLVVCTCRLERTPHGVIARLFCPRHDAEAYAEYPGVGARHVAGAQ